MKKKFRLFSVAMAGLMVVSVLSPFSTLTVQAKSMSVKRGDFTVTGTPGGSSFKNNVLTISGGGTYTISGAGKYTDDRIVVTSSKMPVIKLKNIRIKTKENKPAIEIKGRKGADMRIEGSNYASAVNTALSYTGNERLVLSGNGSLNASGIYASNGKLEIKSGTITSDSPIKAREVKISGGTLNASFGSTVLRNAANQRVFQQTVNIHGAKNKKISSLKVKNIKGATYKYSYSGMKTDENANLNVFLPANTAVVSANVGTTLYSLENTAKAAAEMLRNSSSESISTGSSSLSSNTVLEGTTTPITERLSVSNSLADRINAVTAENTGISYSLLSGPSSASLLRAPSGGGDPDANVSVINVDVSTTGGAESATEASILVNGKVDIFAIEKKVDPATGAEIDMTYAEFIKKFKAYETDKITLHNPDGSIAGTTERYGGREFKYLWTSGEPTVASLQLPDGAKTLAEGLKPGKTLIRCDIDAKYIERKEIQKPVPNSNPVAYTYEVVEEKRELKNVAHVYLTLFVMPDLLDVEVTPATSEIIVGGPEGSSTCDLTAKITGLTDSKPNENTDVTINNVQYVWREVLPKSDMTGSYIAITYGTDNKDIDYKEEDVRQKEYTGTVPINGQTIDKQNGLPNAYKVTVQAQREARNIKVGLKTFLEYTFKTQEYDNKGKPVIDPVTKKQKMVTRTVKTILPEKFVVINIDDKGALTVDKNTLNLTVNSNNSPSVDTVTATLSGARTDLVDFKWWEYSGPAKNSYVDFSNKKGLVAEPDNEDNKALPIYDENAAKYTENKKKMRGSDGATITVQALEAGITYLYVEATYENPDTKTKYTKEAVVKVIIKDGSPNANGGGSGSGGSGSGSGGSGNGQGNGNGQGSNGNGDLLISDLPNVIYNTKAHTPNFTVKSGINLLRSGVDFDYTFMDNIDAGKATLMVNGKNQYDGFWAKKTFDIAKADFVIKNPVLAINTLRANNYTYDLSKLLPATGMTPTDKANTVYKLGKSTLPKTNFSNITNGGNTPILSFDAKGITSEGTQGLLELSIDSSPNFNKASIHLTVKSDSGMKVTFNPKNGQDAFSMNVEPGAKLNVPDTPKKDNATFTGWYKADGKQWNFDTDLVASSIELYAGWRDGRDTGNTETLNYNSNDGRINQSSIDKAVSEHRDLKVNVLNQKGDIVSQWLFDADRLGGLTAGAFDLNTDIYDAEESPAFNLLKEDNDGQKGIGISIGSGSDLPIGSMVKVRASEDLGGRKGRSLYLYKYDSDSHKLLTLPRRSKVKVDSEGYAQIPVLESGDYILATKRPNGKNIVTLNKQIKISKIKSASVGNTKKIKVKASPTLKKVNNLKQAMPYYYGAYSVSFSSSNKKIAKVSKNGNVKFLKKGKVKIYANIRLYNGTKTRKTITVKVK